MNSYEEVVEMLAYYGYTVNADEAGKVRTAIKLTKNDILNFCNIAKITEEMNLLFIKLTALNYLKKVNDVSDSGQVPSGAIKSITEGDVSITYSTSEDDSLSYLEDGIKNIYAELINYRKLAW